MGTLHRLNPVAARLPGARPHERLAIEHEAAKCQSAIRLANQLLAEGYRLLGIQIETRFEPALWVSPDVRLAAAERHGTACYYKQGVDEFGAYRIGQQRREDVLVRWLERPTTTRWWRSA